MSEDCEDSLEDARGPWRGAWPAGPRLALSRRLPSRPLPGDTLAREREELTFAENRLHGPERVARAQESPGQPVIKRARMSVAVASAPERPNVV